MKPRPYSVFLFLHIVFYSLLSAVNGSPSLDYFETCSNFVPRAGIPTFSPYAVIKNFDEVNRMYYIQVVGNLSGVITIVGGNGSHIHAASVYSETYALGKLVTSNTTKLCDVVMDPHSFEVPIKCPWAAGSAAFMVKVPFKSTLSDYSKYELTTLTTRVIVVDGTPEKNVITCMKFGLSTTLYYFYPVISYLVVVSLAYVSFSIIYALFLNPWTGSLDPFKSIFNFNMDPDALRLTSLGFFDFVQYLQFAVSTAQVSVMFPKFYINIMAALSWGTALFRFPIFSEPAEYQFADFADLSVASSSYADYLPKSYGMYSFLDSIGIGTACWLPFLIVMVIYLFAALFVALLVIFLKWLMSRIFNETIAETRWDTWSFIAGSLIRLYFLTYFPTVAYMSFQFVAPPTGYEIIPVLWFIFFGIFIPVYLYMNLAFVEPSSKLLEDQTYLHLFGSIYNSFREERVMFWIFPIAVQFMRGITVGVIGSSGSAQLAIFFILEVANVVAYAYVRPHFPQTSMNTLNTFISTMRLITVILMIPLDPRLKILGISRDLLAYAILFIHIMVCILFLLLSTQRFMEVSARLLGAKSESKGVPLDRPFGWARVFGINELRRRRLKDPYSNGNTMMFDHSTYNSNEMSVPLTPVSVCSNSLKKDGEVAPPKLFVQTNCIPPVTQASSLVPSKNNTASSSSLMLDSPVTPSSPYSTSQGYSFYRPPKPKSSVRKRDMDQLRALQLDFLNNKPNLLRHDVNYAVREADVYHPHVDTSIDSLSQISSQPFEMRPTAIPPPPKNAFQRAWQIVQSTAKSIWHSDPPKESEKGFVVLRSRPRPNLQKPLPQLHIEPSRDEQYSMERKKTDDSLAESAWSIPHP
ncbi:Trp-like ion channel [Schizosaccharomyces pombe]